MRQEIPASKENEVFFCRACLEDKTEADMSPDDRYCQGCHEFLVREAEMLPPSRGRPGWVPKALPQRQQGQDACDKIPTPPDRPVGRPRLVLPVGRIGELASLGHSCRAIAEKMRTEGLEVSYRSVHRVLERHLSEGSHSVKDCD